MQDESLFATCALTFIQRVLEHPDSGFVLVGKLSEAVEDIFEMEFPCRIIEELVRKDEDVMDILDKLDIDRADHRILANILDHNHTDKVKVIDMLTGLQRLRGGQRRSDIISVQLVLEGMQEKLTKLMGM